MTEFKIGDRVKSSVQPELHHSNQTGTITKPYEYFADSFAERWWVLWDSDNRETGISANKLTKIQDDNNDEFKIGDRVKSSDRLNFHQNQTGTIIRPQDRKSVV